MARQAIMYPIFKFESHIFSPVPGEPPCSDNSCWFHLRPFLKPWIVWHHPFYYSSSNSYSLKSQYKPHAYTPFCLLTMLPIFLGDPNCHNQHMEDDFFMDLQYPPADNGWSLVFLNNSWHMPGRTCRIRGGAGQCNGTMWWRKDSKELGGCRFCTTDCIVIEWFQMSHYS